MVRRAMLLVCVLNAVVLSGCGGGSFTPPLGTPASAAPGTGPFTDPVKSPLPGADPDAKVRELTAQLDQKTGELSKQQRLLAEANAVLEQYRGRERRNLTESERKPLDDASRNSEAAAAAIAALEREIAQIKERLERARRGDPSVA